VKAVVQRVRSARVRVADETVGEIGRGLCILLGVADSDTEAGARSLARRVGLLRIFENDRGRFDRSLIDIGGAALVVSQFTLMADTRKGNSPSFAAAAARETAEPLYQAFCEGLRSAGISVQTGLFGARMLVEIENDGPVTIIVETNSTS
jgi:D-tyrosyl-tRNA(Tyr) deacylase